MRVGILLILLQSVLLCAETRAEGQTLQLESADKVVRALLLDGNGEQQDEPDIVLVSSSLVVAFTGAAVAPLPFQQAPLYSAAYTAHPIRGPPARQ
ncbi:hypothetical protein [Microbulbifer hydrolyticus]|uniref:hypothetical protein n=1 Tax=Microbulbifer hydrolyticus TaxID=48074 RepID=UPI001F23A2C6|nr:hypothetical protein [Microbulbifer hydrolyticus]